MNNKPHHENNKIIINTDKKIDNNMKDMKEHYLKDLVIHAIVLICLIIISKIIFFNETLINIARIIGSIYILFIIPGFTTTYFLKGQSLSFLERYILGIVISSASIGIIAYYLNMIGLNFKYITWIVVLLDIILILTTIMINYNNKIFKHKKHNK
ncbi:MAG: hypothetical protein ACP5NV_03345 [Candidatus Woesearchaeota archaeon]